jgi:hypothetical protein
MANWVDNFITYDNYRDINKFIVKYMMDKGFKLNFTENENNLGEFKVRPKLFTFTSKWKPDWKIISDLMDHFPHDMFTIISIDTGAGYTEPFYYGWYVECKNDKIFKGDLESRILSPTVSNKLEKIWNEATTMKITRITEDGIFPKGTIVYKDYQDEVVGNVICRIHCPHCGSVGNYPKATLKRFADMLSEFKCHTCQKYFDGSPMWQLYDFVGTFEGDQDKPINVEFFNKGES